MKTRRGLRGRVLAGALAGGLSYGYDVIPLPDGEQRGARAIDAVKAAVVVRIFRDYAGGTSPKAIAAALNLEKVPSPRGKGWSQSTINGNRKRGTGVLNNELYVGTLIWNRLRYVKDPDTKQRHSRANNPEQIMRAEVPKWRIVDDALWFAVKDRQAKLDALCEVASPDGITPFWKQQRSKHLLSDLIRCGCCGGGMSVISATHLGCSNARNKGEAVCLNRRTVKRSYVEELVLDALRTRLMAPEVYAAFVRASLEEWNHEQKGRSVEQEGKRDELRRLGKSIANLVRAVGESGGLASLLSELKRCEDRKAALEADLAVAEAPAPRLLPNLANVYREKVTALQEALAGEDAAAARERVRCLIEEVRVVPSPADPKAVPAIEVLGALTAMLALGCGSSEAASAALASQFKLVAGAGFEPAAFRL